MEKDNKLRWLISLNVVTCILTELTTQSSADVEGPLQRKVILGRRIDLRYPERVNFLCISFQNEANHLHEKQKVG